MTKKKYSHSLLPFSEWETMMIIVLVQLAMSIIAILIFRKGDLTIIRNIIYTLFAITVIMLVPGQFIYLMMPSSFQKTRFIIKSFYPSSSFIMRLLIYKDGIEVRRVFKCFFIPFDKIDQLEERTSHSINSFIIHSSLENVPSEIRIYLFGSREILDSINKYRNRIIENEKKKEPVREKSVET